MIGLLLLALALAGCGAEQASPTAPGSPTADAAQDQPDPGRPSIRGRISSLNGQSLLVEGQIEADTIFDKAVLRITEQTRIFQQQGAQFRAVGREALKPGLKVEAIVTGPVAESYPIQAAAGQIVILE